MKTKKITTKLTLNKATIAVLGQEQQGNVKGGYYYTKINGGTECYTWDPQCPTLPAYKCGIIVSKACPITQ